LSYLGLFVKTGLVWFEKKKKKRKEKEKEKEEKKETKIEIDERSAGCSCKSADVRSQLVSQSVSTRGVVMSRDFEHKYSGSI